MILPEVILGCLFSAHTIGTNEWTNMMEWAAQAKIFIAEKRGGLSLKSGFMKLCNNKTLVLNITLCDVFCFNLIPVFGDMIEMTYSKPCPGCLTLSKGSFPIFEERSWGILFRYLTVPTRVLVDCINLEWSFGHRKAYVQFSLHIYSDANKMQICGKQWYFTEKELSWPKMRDSPESETSIWLY